MMVKEVQLWLEIERGEGGKGKKPHWISPVSCDTIN